MTSFSASYLNTLAIGNTPDDRPPGPESIVPEEYYGFTNPMANTFPGSKHEQYGGYLRNINGNSSFGRQSSKNVDGSTSSSDATTNSNHQKGYLESLNTIDRPTLFPTNQFYLWSLINLDDFSCLVNLAWLENTDFRDTCSYLPFHWIWCLKRLVRIMGSSLIFSQKLVLLLAFPLVSITKCFFNNIS